MGSVFSYSGLSTKIRALQSKLMTEEELSEIVQLPNVPQIVAYLKRKPEYSRAWANLDENDLHRGQIEKLLKQSIFRNFSKIYHFANKEQRRFLSLYSKRYEILVLKAILHHSKLDLDRLAATTNMEEFVNALKGNEFYGPLSRVMEHGNGLLFDYGMALDLYYFTQIWNLRKKLFKGDDLEEITKAYGEKFDMLNLEFIQRSKRYYHMDPAAIYSLLIPMNYKLKKEEITALVEASGHDEFVAVMNRTYYGRKYPQITPVNLEEFYNYILRTVLEKESRKDPYSVAVIYSYLYHKEHEVNRLTIALECVRYKVGQEEAMRYIRNN